MAKIREVGKSIMVSISKDNIDLLDWKVGERVAVFADTENNQIIVKQVKEN